MYNVCVISRTAKDFSGKTFNCIYVVPAFLFIVVMAFLNRSYTGRQGNPTIIKKRWFKFLCLWFNQEKNYSADFNEIPQTNDLYTLD